MKAGDSCYGSQGSNSHRLVDFWRNHHKKWVLLLFPQRIEIGASPYENPAPALIVTVTVTVAVSSKDCNWGEPMELGLGFHCWNRAKFSPDWLEWCIQPSNFINFTQLRSKKLNNFTQHWTPLRSLLHSNQWNDLPRCAVDEKLRVYCNWRPIKCSADFQSRQAFIFYSRLRLQKKATFAQMKWKVTIVLLLYQTKSQLCTIQNDEVELVRLHLFWFVKLIILKVPATNQVHAAMHCTQVS